MTVEKSEISDIGKLLLSNKLVQLAEILTVFAVAGVIILIGLQFVGENLFAKQLVIMVANLGMLSTVYAGLKLRKQDLSHFGLSFDFEGIKRIFFLFLKSLVVFVAGVSAFILGAIVMANILGTPEQANMSGYNYLKGNLPLLIISLISVFIVSSFGEEVIYRAFLINRISEMGSKTKTAIRLAVIISAIIFGLAHFGWGIVGIVQTTFMGLALAIMYLVFKRNLWILVLAHAYMDALLIVPLYFA